MKLGDEELERIRAFIDAQGERAQSPGDQWLLRRAHDDSAAIGELVDRIEVVPGGIAAAVDQPFAELAMFLPSTMIRTQLLLANHYIQSADDNEAPTLSSFVVLRAAIECTSTAHWLMSGGSHRKNVERVLKRVWWDTQSAVDMATISAGNPDLSSLDELREKITRISKPIKRLEAETITQSSRERLSGIVRDASRALHPDHPAALYAAWMVCAAVSHGNIPVSAGAGLAPALIQEPATHPVDTTVYVQILSTVVTDLRATAELFERHAAAVHAHRPPGVS